MTTFNSVLLLKIDRTVALSGWEIILDSRPENSRYEIIRKLYNTSTLFQSLSLFRKGFCGGEKF